MPVTSIRLHEDLEKLLEEAASRQRKSKHWPINHSLGENLGRDMNEQQRWQETVEALKSASSGKVVGADKVHAWLESWGKDDELCPPKAWRLTTPKMPFRLLG